MMQEIIVYRNPLEAAMWNGIMSGEAFPFMVGLFVFFVSTVFLGTRIEKLSYHNWFRKNQGVSIFLPSTLLSLFVIWFMS